MIAGKRGTEDLGGPIRIAELSGDFWSKGIHSTLWFMMIISLNLGLINLFPIPMLDGGHLLLNLVEYVKGSPLKPKIFGNNSFNWSFYFTFFDGFCYLQ